MSLGMSCLPACVRVLLLLLCAQPVWGGFLSDIKHRAPAHFNPAKLNPAHIRPPKLDQVEALKPAIAESVEVARVAQETISQGPPQVLSEGLQKGEEITTKAGEATAPAIRASAGLLQQGAGVASSVKLGDVNTEARKAAQEVKKASVQADQAFQDMQRAMNALKAQRSSSGMAGALRGASSFMATAVNSTSNRASQFLQSFGPKASAVVTRSGDALACKLSGDCRPQEDDPSLPFDAEDPETWAFWCFTILLVVVFCATSAFALRCMCAAGRKGSAFLSEAMVPLALETSSSSARSPAFQMASSAQDGLLR